MGGSVAYVNFMTNLCTHLHTFKPCLRSRGRAPCSCSLSEGNVVLVMLPDMASENTLRTYLTIPCIGHCVLLHSCRQRRNRAGDVTVSQHTPFFAAVRINIVHRRIPESCVSCKNKWSFLVVFRTFRLNVRVLLHAFGSVHQ